jgi:hypothetical protein
MLPPELVEETLHSLALILPRTDERCRKWFEKERIIQLSYSRLLDSGRGSETGGLGTFGNHV